MHKSITISVVGSSLTQFIIPKIKFSLLKLTQPAAVTKLYEKANGIQDMPVPIHHLKKAVEMFHQEYEVGQTKIVATSDDRV